MKRAIAAIGSIVLGAALLVTGTSGTAVAQPPEAAPGTQVIALKSLDTQDKNCGSFDRSGWSPIHYIGDAASLAIANQNTWHLVYTGDAQDILTVTVTFSDGSIWDWDASLGDQLSRNGGGNNPGFVIAADANLKIVEAYLTSSDAKDRQFNVSGFRCGVPAAPPVGALNFQADLATQHTLTTTTEYYQKTIQPVYEITTTITKQATWARPTASKNDTLVSRLTYTDNTAKATPVAALGGVFKNGHTYVTIPATNGSTTFQIADSSFNANGKKTPDQYNTPIGVSYTATVQDGVVSISFDPNWVISASVGAYVVGADTAAKNNGNGNGNGNNKATAATAVVDRFPGNAPSHKTIAAGGALQVALPANADNGVYYLYVHIDSLKYFTSAEYSFAGWTQIAKETTERQIGNKVTVDLVDSQDVATTITEPYTGALMVTVTNDKDEIIYSGDINGQATDLAPGDYLVNLTGDGVDVTVTATVTANTTTLADFGSIIVKGEDQSVTERAWLAPVAGEPIYQTAPDVVISIGDADDANNPGNIRLN